MFRNKKQKGQYFLLAGFFIVIILYAGLPAATTLVRAESQDIVLLSDNMLKEFPKALNFGYNESGSLETLVNFSRFCESVANGLFMDYAVLWVVAEPNGNDVNITAGNFLGHATTVTLNLSGQVTALAVADNSTNSTLYSSLAAAYNLTIAFDTEEAKVYWPRDKLSLFAFLQIIRGEDIVKKDITG
jgi:hypothetical protein